MRKVNGFIFKVFKKKKKEKYYSVMMPFKILKRMFILLILIKEWLLLKVRTWNWICLKYQYTVSKTNHPMSFLYENFLFLHSCQNSSKEEENNAGLFVRCRSLKENYTRVVCLFITINWVLFLGLISQIDCSTSYSSDSSIHDFN